LAKRKKKFNRKPIEALATTHAESAQQVMHLVESIKFVIFILTKVIKKKNNNRKIKKKSILKQLN
jgi:hypothetical protein